MVGGKKFNFFESYVVIVIKEEELKIDIKEIFNFKDKIIFFRVLGES